MTSPAVFPSRESRSLVDSARMKLSTKRALDHYVGSICLLSLSWLVRMLGLALRRDHQSLPVQAVVILKFQGIGSLAIAKRAISKLHARYPSARFVFWGTSSTCALAREMGEFDEVLVLDDRDPVRAGLSAAKNLLRIYHIKPDWVIDLEVYSKLSVVLCTLTCGRNRAGFAVDSVRLRRMNHTHLVFFNRHHYLGHAYKQLLGLIGLGSEQAVELKSEEPCRRDTRPLSAEIPTDRDYIVINPNAGELSLERRWPIAFFEQLINRLLARFPDLNIFIVGAGQAEARYCQALANDVRVRDLVDRLSLPELISCVERARLVISNDSAPLHFALMYSVPVVGLFGPTDPTTYVDSQRPNTRIHYAGLYCSPCVHYWEPPPCKGWNQCMSAIGVDDILGSACELLDENLPMDWRVVGTVPLTHDNRYYPGLVYARDHSDAG